MIHVIAIPDGWVTNGSSLPWTFQDDVFMHWYKEGTGHERDPDSPKGEKETQAEAIRDLRERGFVVGHPIQSALEAIVLHDELVTLSPIQKNFRPDAWEMLFRLACHVLQDATGHEVILMGDSSIGLYLTPEIGWECDDEAEPRPDGTVEYMVSDGLPGNRTHSESYFTLREAIARFKGVQAAGGFANLHDWGDDEEDELPPVPEDFEVRVLDDDENPPGKMTCGICGRSWDDSIGTTWTPVPSGRCPFEYYHK